MFLPFARPGHQHRPIGESQFEDRSTLAENPSHYRPHSYMLHRGLHSWYSSRLTSTRLVSRRVFAVNMRRAARHALAAPLIVTGGILVLTLGTANVFAASGSAKTPVTSSGPHEHEHVSCSPGTFTEEHGQCRVTFLDTPTSTEHPLGQQVCFTVNHHAGAIGTGGMPSNCALVKHTSTGDKALGTFTANDTYCGQAVITATEAVEGGQTRHTTITLTCAPSVSTTSAIVPAGGPQAPIAGWLLGAIGVGVALVAGFALRARRWLAPRRRSAGQSA
jgi:hypothetical protein